MKTSEIVKWASLVAFVATTLIGQAELIGEPWRHYVTVIGVIATAISGYFIQHQNKWDGTERREHL